VHDISPDLGPRLSPAQSGGSTTPRRKISRFNGNDLVIKVMENKNDTVDPFA
jgi:hypothetical protein